MIIIINFTSRVNALSLLPLSLLPRYVRFAREIARRGRYPEYFASVRVEKVARSKASFAQKAAPVKKSIKTRSPRLAKV